MLDREAILDLDEHQPRPPRLEIALDEVRVIDFSHFVAGPLATMLLADYGADVIKIENPEGGDLFRRYPPSDTALEDQGGAYLWANRNKRSVALDLKTHAGQELVRSMIASADVLVENFSTGIMEKLGLDYKTCAALNPRLIYCSVSAYGREGEFSDRVAFDTIVQAESGFMSMNGEPDRPPVRATPSIMDIATALMASNAILIALHARQKTGRGQFVETALFDTSLTMVGFAAMQHLFSGQEPTRCGNISTDNSPSAVFSASDREFLMTCSNDRLFRRLCREVIDRSDLVDDPSFRTSEARLKNRDRLINVLKSIFSTQRWEYWRERFRAAAVPAAEIRTLSCALRAPETKARRLVTRIPHPKVGWIPNIALPIRLSETPAIFPTPAPALGQHTGEVVREILGIQDDAASKQRGASVIPRPAGL